MRFMIKPLLKTNVHHERLVLTVTAILACPANRGIPSNQPPKLCLENSKGLASAIAKLVELSNSKQVL